MSEHQLLHHSQRITQQLLDIIFPPHCAGCQKGGAVLCSTCRASFTTGAAPTCRQCGRPLPIIGLCPYCRSYTTGLSGLYAVGSFQGALRSCIHALKYDGNTRLADPLGEVLAEGYMHWRITADVMLPVPLHLERQRQRGYNHAQLLAEACATRVHIPLRNDILIRHRATSAQVGLNAQERQQNVTGAFECTPAFKTGALSGRTILIIDDVYTTGATLSACAAPLFACGAKAVCGLILAQPA